MCNIGIRVRGCAAGKCSDALGPGALPTRRLHAALRVHSHAHIIRRNRRRGGLLLHPGTGAPREGGGACSPLESACRLHLMKRGGRPGAPQQPAAGHWCSQRGKMWRVRLGVVDPNFPCGHCHCHTRHLPFAQSTPHHSPKPAVRNPQPAAADSAARAIRLRSSDRWLARRPLSPSFAPPLVTRHPPGRTAPARAGCSPRHMLPSVDMTPVPRSAWRARGTRPQRQSTSRVRWCLVNLRLA